VTCSDDCIAKAMKRWHANANSMMACGVCMGEFVASPPAGLNLHHVPTELEVDFN